MEMTKKSLIRFAFISGSVVVTALVALILSAAWKHHRDQSLSFRHSLFGELPDSHRIVWEAESLGKGRDSVLVGKCILRPEIVGRWEAEMRKHPTPKSLADLGANLRSPDLVKIEQHYPNWKFSQLREKHGYLRYLIYDRENVALSEDVEIYVFAIGY